jgi:cytochrome b561
MPVADRASLSSFPSAREAARYDGITVTLHWLTAVLVVVLFGIAITFNELGRGTPVRHNLQLVHVSLGISLAAVFILRLLWRSTVGRTLSRHSSRASDRKRCSVAVLAACGSVSAVSEVPRPKA